MKTISGNKNPKAEQKTFYEVFNVIPDFSSPLFGAKPVIKYTWTLFKNINGSWSQVVDNIKHGVKVPYTFGEKVVGVQFRIDVHQEEKNFANQIQNKLVASLIVTLTTSKEPVIGRVILLNKNNSDVNKAKLNESLTAQARTSNLLGKDITFYLWEEGTSELEKYKKPKNGRVNNNGIAEVKFDLSEYSSQQTLMSFFQLNSNATKKFYVSAVYENKIRTNKTPVTARNGQPQTPRTQQPQTPPPTNNQSQNQNFGILSATREIIAEGFGNFIKNIENVISATQINPNSPQVVSGNTEKGECFCNKDFTTEDFEKIIHGLRDSELRVKKDSGYSLFTATNCKIKTEDKTIDKLRIEFNSIFTRYNINTCLRKLHFIAQIYHETDRLRTAKEYADGIKYDPGKHKDATSSGNTEKGDGEKYKGRGLMQLTWKNNYKIYKYHSKFDVIKDYTTVSDDLYYACDSAGWYWKQGKILSVGKRWKGPADPPLYVKILKPDYPKTTISWQDGTTKKEYGTVDLGLLADDDKVDLISYLVNGGANGLNERRNYVNTLKIIFEYPQKCVNKKSIQVQNNQTSGEAVTIRLVRKWQTNKSTIGEFTIDNTTIKGYILEEKGPDTIVSGNEQRVPIGTYNLEWHHGTIIKKGLKLFNDVVSKDRAILIHGGNTADDTEGCLLPGVTKGVNQVGSSQKKLKEIFDYVEEIGIKDAKIIITQAYE